MTTKRIKQGEEARSFTLVDTHDKAINLSDYEGKQNVFLVFNRGFS